MKRFASLAGLLTAVGLVALPADPALAAGKAIHGISCGGGFFVKTPSDQVFWIADDNVSRESVYDGGHPLFAMAACGGGIISVFDLTWNGQRRFAAYFSPDCRNIGAETGQSRLLYDGAAPVRRITPGEKGVAIGLAGGRVVETAECTSAGN